MVLPAFFERPDVLVAERATVGLARSLLGVALARGLVRVKLILVERLLAGPALPEVVLLLALFDKVIVKHGNLYNLCASVTVCQHQARCQVMDVELLAISELCAADPTELAFVFQLSLTFLLLLNTNSNWAVCLAFQPSCLVLVRFTRRLPLSQAIFRLSRSGKQVGGPSKLAASSIEIGLMRSSDLILAQLQIGLTLWDGLH
jgi:hypothetical protein